MTLASIQSSIRRWLQPRTLSIVISALLIVWGAWQGWSVSREGRITSSDVATRELRVDTAKLEAVKTRLEKYGQPANPVPVNTNLFTPVSAAGPTEE